VKFRKKPIEITAVQWTGDNADQLAEFTGGRFEPADDSWDEPEITGCVYDELHSTWVGLRIGDWVLRGIRGEFYPCAAAVFAETYEPA
jgi:hypothetical protein